MLMTHLKLTGGIAERRHVTPFLHLLICMAVVGGASASQVLAEDYALAGSVQLDDWQLRRLLQPTAAELQREGFGEIVIYDGLTDQQVEAALSAYPERMRSMMFVGTIMTDEQGQPLMDPVGGFVQQDEGC
jgi:hypothetical protein